MNLMPYNTPAYFPPAYFAVGASQAGAGGGVDPTLPPTTGRTPYNAPSYFPSSFFAGLTPASPLPLVGRTPYNTPSYFATTYFAGAVVTNSQPTPTVIPLLVGRDGSAYLALLDSLTRAGMFASVRFGDPTRRPSAGADAAPWAVVIPQGWEESDETDPTLLIRRASFVVRLTVRVTDDLDPFSELDRLTRVVQARVDHSDLGGACVPGLTRIRAGRYQASDRYPEWSVDLDGEFTTLVDPATP